MPWPTPTSPCFSSTKRLFFSGYALDLQRCALLRGDHEIRIRPKSFDVLRYLAEHPGRLVSKEELIRAAWREVFVTDDSLVQCIREIREALSERRNWSSEPCHAAATYSRANYRTRI